MKNGLKKKELRKKNKMNSLSVDKVFSYENKMSN